MGGARVGEVGQGLTALWGGGRRGGRRREFKDAPARNGSLRLAPTPPRKGPSPARTGSFGGRKPSNGSPHGSPVYWGELKLPPRMGGVETPPISLITPFLYDINPV